MENLAKRSDAAFNVAVLPYFRNEKEIAYPVILDDIYPDIYRKLLLKMSLMYRVKIFIGAYVRITYAR